LKGRVPQNGQIAHEAKKRSRRGNGRSPQTAVLLFAGFVLKRNTTTIIGPMLPFSSEMVLDDGQAGFFSTIQFLPLWRHSGIP